MGGGTLSVFEEMTHSLGIVLPLLVYIKLHGMRMCPQEVLRMCQALSLFWGAGLGGGGYKRATIAALPATPLFIRVFLGVFF